MSELKTGIYALRAHREGMRIVEGRAHIQKNFPDYLRDESNAYGSGVEKLFFPKTAEHVSYIVKESLKEKKPVTISGGRTGICAGAVPEGGWLLSLEKMRRILSLSWLNDHFELKVESGLRLSELEARIGNRELGLDGSAVERFLKSDHTYIYPPDPTETTAMIGGTVATNASGARTFYYGPTRRWISEMEVVIPTGELLRIRRGEVKERNGWFSVMRENGSRLRIPAPCYEMPSTKHSAGLHSQRGMDLIDLFIGSEGILGIIINVTVVLIPRPGLYIGGVGFFDSEEKAFDFVINSRRSEHKPLALEYFDSGSLMLLEERRRRQGLTSEIPEIPGISSSSRVPEISVSAVYFESPAEGDDDIRQRMLWWRKLIEKSGGDPAVCWGAITGRDINRLKSFRHALPETVNEIIAQNKMKDPRIHKVGTDMAVVDEHLIDMIDFYRSMLRKEGLRHVIFGHIGNNHLHVNMIPNNWQELERAKKLYGIFARKAVSLGGTVSAEHGIGKLKREYLKLLYSDEQIQQMRMIKRFLDPEGIINPGNMFELTEST